MFEVRLSLDLSDNWGRWGVAGVFIPARGGELITWVGAVVTRRGWAILRHGGAVTGRGRLWEGRPIARLCPLLGGKRLR